MAERVRRHVVVRGHVQGVFFRDSVREQAEAEGVAGWVSNRSDGAVEAELEGAPEAVQRVIGFCRDGPSRAEVEDVQVEEREPESASGFEIR